MSATHLVAVIHGDGIGIDVTDAAVAIVEAAQKVVGGFSIAYDDIDAGAIYYRETGRDITPGGEERAGEADAILLGAIGHPAIRGRWH
ncbi:isocitrate/isopropylmalate family dehydrogenase [Bradyrhizobium sp. USDA 336]|uniref:isocitrate/isopropylmalate family dehydrogenase n=1 Tax=Bradyrhizobium sp. USDA 336 TaxID=3156311 RepID=UPI003837606C